MLSITNGVRYYDIELHLYRLLIHQVAICSHLIIVTVSKKILWISKVLTTSEPCDIYRFSPHKFETVRDHKQKVRQLEAVKGGRHNFFARAFHT